MKGARATLYSSVLHVLNRKMLSHVWFYNIPRALTTASRRAIPAQSHDMHDVKTRTAFAWIENYHLA